MDNDIRLDLDDTKKYLQKELDLWVTHERDDLRFCMVVVIHLKKLEEILGDLCEAWEAELNDEIDVLKEAQK